MFAIFIVKNKNRKYVQIVTIKTVKYDTDMKFFTPPFKVTARDMRYFVKSKFFGSLVH